MQVFFYQNHEHLQSLLGDLATKQNGGICEYYNYCKYCKEPQSIVRQSKTPCADAFLACGEKYVYGTRYDSSDERKENYKKFVLYGATIVNVNYINRKTGKLSDMAYSYIADVPVQVGDIVKVPTSYGSKDARVNRVDVPIGEIKCRVGELRHITEAATPGGDLFNGFFD